MELVEIPIGVRFLQFLSGKLCRTWAVNRQMMFRLSVLTLTFITYSCYHASRKPLSVVKSYFSRSCEGLSPPSGTSLNDTTWCDWAPFYGPHASTILGALDSAFLFSYAASMFISGFVAERVSIRYFLAVGMICSGISCYLFGIARNLDIHDLWYYVVVQAFGGIVQTTGWPGVVAVMGNWFGKGNRGLIFGIWNSHTSVGNIVGALVASELLEIDWALSFMIPGLMIAAAGFLNFLFLVDSPSDVGCEDPDASSEERNCDIQGNSSSIIDTSHDDSADSDTELLPSRSIQTKSCNGILPEENKKKAPPVDVIGALKIPGVIEFSLCLFFSKLVNYTFLYWLPYYIKASTIYNESISADLSTIFDVGGILGGIFAGFLSDYLGRSATTCSVMLILSIPLLFLYNLFGATGLWLNITILSLLGFFVNGPYALITTAVSADLGTHKSLQTNSKALATVTAIIDGTGSLGAAIGPLLAGFVFQYGWTNVFYMLMVSNVFALITLTRLVKKEIFPMLELFS